MNQSPTTYAELDAANVAHYQRKAERNEARANAAFVWTRRDQLIDKVYDRAGNEPYYLDAPLSLEVLESMANAARFCEAGDPTTAQNALMGMLALIRQEFPGQALSLRWITDYIEAALMDLRGQECDCRDTIAHPDFVPTCAICRISEN